MGRVEELRKMVRSRAGRGNYFLDVEELLAEVDRQATELAALREENRKLVVALHESCDEGRRECLAELKLCCSAEVDAVVMDRQAAELAALREVTQRAIEWGCHDLHCAWCGYGANHHPDCLFEAMRKALEGDK